MLEGKTKKESVRAFLLTLLFLSFGAFVYSYREILENYNSTVLAFSYRYGFISRGLIGTLYHLLDAALPIDLISYDAALYTTLILTLLIFAVFFWIAYRMLAQCREELLGMMEGTVVFLMLNLVTTFSSKRNLGRLDLYMILVSVLAVCLIVEGKHLWAVAPLSALGVMVHQGYVFMYFNMIAALLCYRFLTEKKKKYLAALIISAATVSALFLWFQFFSHAGGSDIAGSITREAAALSRNGKYHETLIEAEILGRDLTEQEWPMHVENWIELPVFLLFMSPYIAILTGFFGSLLKKCKGALEKLKYHILFWGVLTILPNFILKVDYARWFLAVALYYLVIFAALLLLGDPPVKETALRYGKALRSRCGGMFILVLYPLLFLPFWDVHICELLKNISNPINETWLHLW